MALEEPFVACVPRVALSTTPDDLAGLYDDLLVRVAERDRPVDTSHLQPIPITVEQASQHLVGQLRVAGGRATFRALTRTYRSRVEVAVAFVAVLELYKNEHVDVEQTAHFGDMVIELTNDEPVAVTSGNLTVERRPMVVQAGR